MRCSTRSPRRPASIVAARISSAGELAFSQGRPGAADEQVTPRLPRAPPGHPVGETRQEQLREERVGERALGAQTTAQGLQERVFDLAHGGQGAAISGAAAEHLLYPPAEVGGVGVALLGEGVSFGEQGRDGGGGPGRAQASPGE
jgi:hypothetical protein